MKQSSRSVPQTTRETRDTPAPDPASVLASLASAAAQLASQAQQAAELLASGTGTSTSSLALLGRPEAVMASMPAHKLLLSQAEAAALLGVHPRTLARMRAGREGPKAIKIRGALRYRRRDVERWLEGKRS